MVVCVAGVVVVAGTVVAAVTAAVASTAVVAGMPLFLMVMVAKLSDNYNYNNY